MNHEHFFQWWWSYPSLFSYSFFEEKVLPFVVSFVNPLVFTRWRSTPGSYSARSMKNNNNNNNNNNILKQQHWTMNIFQWWWSYPSLWFTFIFWEEGLTLLRFICQSPGFHQVELKDLLVFTGGGAGRAQKSPHDAGREFQWDSCWLDSFSGRCWA